MKNKLGLLERGVGVPSSATVDVQVVVFALGPGSVQSDLDHLVSALQQCCCGSPRDGQKAGDSRAVAAYRSLQQAPAPSLNPREAFFASKEM